MSECFPIVSLESIDLRGVTKFDPRGMIATINVEDH